MSGENRKVSSAGYFAALVGTRPESYDPSIMDPPAPGSLKTTANVGVIHTEGGSLNSAQMTVTSAGTPISMRTGTVTVADNDFTDEAFLLLGEYEIHSHRDFAVGVASANTATNIVNFINTLPGFSASSSGGLTPVITITWKEPAGKVVFRALHRGAKVNFTPLSPTTGFLGGGSPYAGNLP